MNLIGGCARVAEGQTERQRGGREAERHRGRARQRGRVAERQRGRDPGTIKLEGCAACSSFRMETANWCREAHCGHFS
jgi:hypothetical protein